MRAERGSTWRDLRTCGAAHEECATEHTTRCERGCASHLAGDVSPARRKREELEERRRHLLEPRQDNRERKNRHDHRLRVAFSATHARG
eukprot:1203031-Prymnesium_polylepis.1